MSETSDQNGVAMTKKTNKPGEGLKNGHKGTTVVSVADEANGFSNKTAQRVNGAGKAVAKDNGIGVDNDDNDDADKDRGCCGRLKKKEQVNAVGALELFKFATCFDKFLMLIGTIGAMGQGVTFPVNIAIFGEVIDIFINDELKSANATGNGTADGESELVEEMLPFIYIFIGLGAASFICCYLAVACWQWAAERQVCTMRKEFFHAVMRQEIGWFDVHEAGEISSRFSEDVSKIAEGMGDKMAVFLQWGTTWIACYVMSFTRSWKLSLAMIVFSPMLIFIGAMFVRVMRKMATKEAKAYAKAGAVAEQAFRAIRTVQAFQGQEKEVTKYETNLILAVKVASKKGLALGVGSSFMWFLLFIMFAGVIWFGTYLIQEEALSSGSVLPVFFGVMMGSISLGNAFSNLESFSNARGAATKVFDIIALQPVINAFSEEGVKPSTLTGHIQFKNIRFSYPARPEVVVLEDLNLTIEPGQTVALVGPSGCGKSTTVGLLQRFYDPEGGSVCVDGHNIKDLNLRWLRQNIGVVSQEPSLFDATIEENIRFGKMDATMEEIQNAAKEANAHDFIMQLPEKYKTNVGERGAQLSGGQKQRISIARALVRNPKILLLDEATSALDHESEAIVQNALEKAEKGRSTIIIAHRLSTIKHADKIVTICDGEVVEQGTHDALMAAEGLYYQLVQIQAKIDKETQIDIEDVEIVEQDENENGDDDVPMDEEALVRASMKRTLSITSDKSAKRKISLVVRTSGRKKKNFFSKKSAENEEMGDEEFMQVKLTDIMRYNAPEWILITLGCFGSIIAGVIHPAFSFLLSEFIKAFGIRDHAEQWTQMHILAGSVIGVAVVSGVVRLLQSYCFSKSGAHLTARLRKLTFASIINQDMEYFDRPNNQVGSLTTKLSGDAALVQGATGSKIGQILESLSTLACALTIAFIFGWKLAFVVLSFMPLMVLGGIVQGKVVAGASKRDKSQLQQAGKICSEVVDNIRTVVSLGREDHFIHKFDGLIDATVAANRKMSLVFGATYGIANCLIFFAYATSFYYGGVLVSQKEMEFYEVFRVFSAIIFGGMMIGRQSSFGIDFTKAKLAAARIITLINRKPKIDVRDDEGQTIDGFKGSISVVDAVFHYSSRPNIAVLNDMNLTVNPGETVALVGSSGCGKSTTTQLIERFYDVDSGSLRADGEDIRNLNLTWYRRQLGIVSQEPTLFDCSIAENIAYGDNSRVVPMEEIIQAAKNANIHNFIASLPQGYDTSVGDKGTQLSGGQKQRIAIARALVRNPKILLLDEATSALDSESEKIVQEALDKASQNRTCITIAHRLSTIQNADKIAVVSKGKIVEIGTHSELMTTKGAYYRLQKAQNRPHKGQ